MDTNVTSVTSVANVANVTNLAGDTLVTAKRLLV
jgi:hypothetical protein